MRSVIYENQLYPNYSKKAIVADKVEGWRNFLTDLGVGHVLNSTDLRAIPGSELLNKLKPMLSDPDLVFTLEFNSGALVSDLQTLAEDFDYEIPRQSSAYILSTAAKNLSLSDRPVTKGAAQQQKANVKKYTEAADAAYSAWSTNLSRLQSYKVSFDIVDGKYVVRWSDSDIKDPWPGTNVKKAYDKLKQKIDSVDYSVSEFPSAMEFEKWKNPEANAYTWDVMKAVVMAERNLTANEVWNGQNISTSMLDRVGFSERTPETFYTATSKNKPFIDSIKAAENFILEYFAALNSLLEQHVKLTWTNNIVVRFYPQNATISEPIPTVNTVPLSENSFVQVASPQQNIMISLIGNMALDTPDTQWRELYAKIFKAILKHGNPPCKARIGRYLIDKCYLFQVTDLSQTTNSAPVFNVSLISEHYDTNNLQSINYVG